MSRKLKAKKRRSDGLPPPPQLHETPAVLVNARGVDVLKPSSWKQWLFAAGLAALVFMAYQPAWRGGVIWDDDAHITRPELRSIQGLNRIWFDLGATQQYYPLLHSAFWLEHKLWGDDTLGYHLVNLSLHVLAALLVAMLLRMLNVPGAWLAAAIFALHPVQVESVAWITELKNTLSAVFYLSAAIVYLRFDQSRKLSSYLAALGLFALGLFSKTVVATLPASLLVVVLVGNVAAALPGWRRHQAAASLFRRGRRGRHFHRLCRAQADRRRGRRLRLLVRRALPDRGTGYLVLPRQALRTAHTNSFSSYPRWQINQAAVWQYLFPLGVLLLTWRRCGSALSGRRTQLPLTRFPIICRDALPGPWVFQRLSVYLFVRRRPFSIPGEPGHHHLILGRRGVVVEKH